MTLIPKSHPRLNSLLIREKLVKGFDDNLVAIASSKEAELTAKRLAISNQQASAKKVEDEKRRRCQKDC